MKEKKGLLKDITIKIIFLLQVKTIVLITLQMNMKAVERDLYHQHPTTLFSLMLWQMAGWLKTVTEYCHLLLLSL